MSGLRFSELLIAENHFVLLILNGDLIDFNDLAGIKFT